MHEIGGSTTLHRQTHRIFGRHVAFGWTFRSSSTRHELAQKVRRQLWKLHRIPFLLKRTIDLSRTFIIMTTTVFCRGNPPKRQCSIILFPYYINERRRNFHLNTSRRFGALEGVGGGRLEADCETDYYSLMTLLSSRIISFFRNLPIHIFIISFLIQNVIQD